ncbi:MAG: hypothetical protein HDR00_09280 [Lachnospiraceae bacterium]|nr:hypothetical protein [Lachnospiraceae bacterium]
MKRLYIFFLLTFLVFSFSGNVVYATSASSSDLTGFDNWSFEDQASWMFANIPKVISSFAGLFLSPGNSDWRDLMEDIWRDDYLAQNYSSYSEFLAAKASYNPTLQTLTFDPEAIEFLNKFLEQYKEDVTYQDCYFASNYSLPADWFQTKKASDILHEIIKNNPDKMFSLGRFVHGSGNDGGWRVPDYGYSSIVRVRFADVAYAAVSTQDADKYGTPNATLYNDDWNQNIIWHEFIIFDGSDNSATSGHLVYTNDSGEYVIIKDKDSAINFDLSLASKSIEIGSNSYLASLNPTVPASPFANLNPTMVPSVVFTSHQGAIPVFVSEAAMKKGTADGVQGQYMPNYTGQPITNNTISQTEINDYSTYYNYYYGSGGSGDGSGSGSESGSSGGWLDSILNGLGSLGNAVMSILSKLFEMVTKVIEFFTVTLTDAMDAIPTGYANFLAALFPFLPKEWITAVTLFLGLLVAGVLIKIISKFF